MKKTIFIVDDVYSNRFLLTQILSDYNCIGINDGYEMWRILKHSFPDLIIMDIGLPGENGLHLADQLSHNERYKNIPIVFLTAHASKDEIIEGMRLGGYDYLVKPVNEDLLLERVRMILDRNSPEDKNDGGDSNEGKHKIK